MNKSAPKPKLFNISSQTMTIYGVDEVEVARQLTRMPVTTVLFYF